MKKPYDPSQNELEPLPECRATLERIQAVMDGEAGVESLDADSHPAVCPACRERVRAARMLLSVLTAPREPVEVPGDFADRVVKAMWEDRHVRVRRRVYAATAWLALAAAILIALYTFVNPDRPEPVVPLGPAEVVHKPDAAPAPHTAEPKPAPTPTPVPAPAPHPRPIRISDEVAKAGQTLLETRKPITDSVAVAPKLFDALTEPFKLPAPPADPMTNALDPARKSITELPVVARTGLEPVTGTAEKAFSRFLRDVGAVKPNS